MKSETDITAPQRVFVGTSGWTYDDWSGVFYPKAIKAADRLVRYCVMSFPHQ